MEHPTWCASRAKIGRLRITFAKSYYEIWLAGLLRPMLAERGLVSAEEIDAGRPPPGEPKKVDGHPCSTALFGQKRHFLAVGRPNAREAFQRSFRIGDRVRAKNIHPTTHTRLPRYV